MKKPASYHFELICFLIVANLLTQYLFFIDEGYHDFRWMKEWGNWLVYIFYVGFFFLVQTAGLGLISGLKKLWVNVYSSS